jgi:hypothetical protein
LTVVPFRPAQPPLADPSLIAVRREGSPFESLADFWAYYIEMSRKRMARLMAELGMPPASDELALAA